MLEDAIVKVYPRVCGGTVDAAKKDGVYRGLSPRVRGNLVLESAGSGTMRSIPACAGEPRLDDVSHDEPEVYPRVCGGTNFGVFLIHLVQGLSPRVRGNLVDCGDSPNVSRVYPRVCGGTRH